MFSMCSELTPRAHIPDTGIPQLMQPCTGAMSYTTIHYAVSWVAMSYSLRRGRENAAVNKRSSDIWTL